jgi:hypothetical protein
MFCRSCKDNVFFKEKDKFKGLRAILPLKIIGQGSPYNT